MFRCKVTRLQKRDLTSLLEIFLVAHQQNDDARTSQRSGIVQPIDQRIVRVAWRCIVDEQSTSCSSIVGSGDGTETLLTGSVPDL